MVWYVHLAAILYFASILKFGDGYRILAVCPTPLFSHQMAFRGLTLALNKRGHELVVVTTDPVNDPGLKNYTEIDVSFGYGVFGNPNHFDIRGKVKFIDIVMQEYESMLNFTDHILSHPDLKKLYAPDSNEKFDVLLIELLGYIPLYPLATRFGVPMIGTAPLAIHINVHFDIGNPVSSLSMSHPEYETELSENPSFWQRLRNFYTLWRFIYFYRTTFAPGSDAIAKKHFGRDIPHGNDLAKNVSLFLINQQRAISYARPNVPKVIEIGGFLALKESTTGLSKGLEKMLDEATEGFVYMSLGTYAESTMMPRKTMEQFIAAFSRLPYKVLWKFENDILPGKPDNVHIMRWVPQQAVLAHPNLKVFIYQGGVQSTEEAVHHAIPLIGIPILGDQDMQVMKMISLGVARKVEIRTLNANELFEAISTVASDISYKQRMLDLRSLMEDKPHDPLETAMWWIEHVIRHKGAPQLHSSTADQPWYSRQDMDIVAFLTAGSIILLCFALVVSYQLLKIVYGTCIAKSFVESKKMN